MFSAFLKDSAVYAVPALLSRGMALLLFPLYTRVLSPADYGSLDLFIVFAAIVNLTVSLEISQAVARFYAAEPDDYRKVGYASSAFWFTLACYTLFAALTLPLTTFLTPLIMGQEGLETAFRLGIGYIYFNGIFHLIQNQFRWELRSIHYAATSFVMTFVTAITSVWFGYGLNLGLEGLLIGMMSGCFLGVVVGMWHLRDSFRIRFSSLQLREMLAFSWPLALSGIAVWVSTYVDRLMINNMLSIEDLGLYGAGFRLASIAGLAMIGIQGALTPLVYAHYKDPDTPQQLSRIFSTFVMLALTFILVIVLFASDLLKLLATDNFFGAKVVIPYLAPAILFSQMYIFASGIWIAKKTYLIVQINIAIAVLNIGLNFVLIPMLGITGASLATLVSSACAFIAYMFFSQRFYPVPHDWKRLVAATGTAILIAAALPQLGIGVLPRWILNILGIMGLLGVFALLQMVDVKRLFRTIVSAIIRPRY